MAQFVKFLFLIAVYAKGYKEGGDIQESGRGSRSGSWWELSGFEHSPKMVQNNLLSLFDCLIWMIFVLQLLCYLSLGL